MMKEMYVPFQLLEKLKAKGYPIPKNVIFGMYDDDKSNRVYKLEWDFLRSKLFAPTIEQVLAWLRKEKKIHVSISPLLFNGDSELWWTYAIQDITDGSFIAVLDVCTKRESYEEAALAGIGYVIDRLIV